MIGIGMLTRLGICLLSSHNLLAVPPPSYWIEEREESTISEGDIELELAAKDELTTADARFHLQSLLDYSGDAQIIITQSEVFVKAFDKTFVCENDEVLEEVCKAISYLSRQETT